MFSKDFMKEYKSEAEKLWDGDVDWWDDEENYREYAGLVLSSLKPLEEWSNFETRYSAGQITERDMREVQKQYRYSIPGGDLRDEVFFKEAVETFTGIIVKEIVEKIRGLESWLDECFCYDICSRIIREAAFREIAEAWLLREREINPLIASNDVYLREQKKENSAFRRFFGKAEAK